MRILFFVEHFRSIGGAENLAVSVCKELSKRGHEIHVICKDGEEIDSIKTYKRFSNIKEIVKEIKPDLTFDWGLFEKAHLSRLGGSIHKIFLEYSLFSYPLVLRPFKWISYKLGKHRKKIKHQEYVLSSKNTIYIAPSNFVKEHCLRYGLPENRIRVIYNGVDLNRFFPPSNEQRVMERKKWDIGINEVVFLFIAHNLKLKNIALLKKVFDKLYKKHPFVKLLVTGKRRPRFNAPYLIYTGAIQDMHKIYWVADVLVHPSYFDTFGSVVLEAMASGIPAVVSSWAGASEIVEDSGIVLPVVGKNVPVLWMQGLEKMLDKALREKMGDNARKISQKYEFISYVNKIEALFKEVLSTTPY